MQNKVIIPELFVLGAGPGDPELITVKGYKILQQADVILYDTPSSVLFTDALNLAPVVDKKYTPEKRLLILHNVPILVDPTRTSKYRSHLRVLVKKSHLYCQPVWQRHII